MKGIVQIYIYLIMEDLPSTNQFLLSYFQLCSNHGGYWVSLMVNPRNYVRNKLNLRYPNIYNRVHGLYFDPRTQTKFCVVIPKL